MLLFAVLQLLLLFLFLEGGLVQQEAFVGKLRHSLVQRAEHDFFPSYVQPSAARLHAPFPARPPFSILGRVLRLPLHDSFLRNERHREPFRHPVLSLRGLSVVLRNIIFKIGTSSPTSMVGFDLLTTLLHVLPDEDLKLLLPIGDSFWKLLRTSPSIRRALLRIRPPVTLIVTKKFPGGVGTQAPLSKHLEKTLELGPLTFLTLDGIGLGLAGVSMFCQLWQKSLRLQSLDLSNNKLGPAGVVCVCDVLQHDKRLQILLLEAGVGSAVDGPCGPTGATAMGTALGVNGTLLTLNLVSNDLRAKGGTALAKGLGNNSSLTCLKLEYNKLGDEAAALVIKSLPKNCLRNLDMWMNNLGPDAAKALFDLIQNNVLERLDVSANFCPVLGKSILDAMITNTSVKWLNLEFNNAEDPLKAEYERLRDSNHKRYIAF